MNDSCQAGNQTDLRDCSAYTKSPRTKFGIGTCKQIELTSLNEWSIDINFISLGHIYSMFCGGFISERLVVRTATADRERSNPFK